MVILNREGEDVVPRVSHADPDMILYSRWVFQLEEDILPKLLLQVWSRVADNCPFDCEERAENKCYMRN